MSLFRIKAKSTWIFFLWGFSAFVALLATAPTSLFKRVLSQSHYTAWFL